MPITISAGRNPPVDASHGSVFTDTVTNVFQVHNGQRFADPTMVSPTITGTATVGQLTVSTAAGKIVPGATSISVRNNADNADNLFISNAGLVGIRSAANANMTTGLTINQGAADDEILALKSSDVNHAMTGVTEADTYGSFRKSSATSGGTWLRGFSSATVGLLLTGAHTTDNTTKSTSGSGATLITAQLRSGTGVTDCGADANLVVIRNNATTRFIFDAEGSGHADVEFVAFDAHDDIQALDALTHEFVARKNPEHRHVTNEFGAWLDERRDLLQKAKIVNFYDDGPRAMVNFTRLAMLHTGALRQLGARLTAIEEKLGLPAGYAPKLLGEQPHPA